MKVAKGDLIASVFLAFVMVGFFALVYNVNPDIGWLILADKGLSSFLFST